MRRKQCEVTNPETIENILSSCTIGRMATVGKDGYPYITPVNFVSMKGMIYFHSAPQGQKLDNIKRDGRTCFEVDVPLAYVDSAYSPENGICRLHQLYHCVIIQGRARVLDYGPTKVAALRALVAKHEKSKELPKLNIDDPAVDACAVVEIKVEKVSAKSDLWQGKPTQEREALAAYLLRRGLPGDSDTVEAMGFPI